MNKVFHREDLVMYSRKSWQQIKAKDCSMRSKVIEVQLGLIEEVKTREQAGYAPLMLIGHGFTSA